MEKTQLVLFQLYLIYNHIQTEKQIWVHPYPSPIPSFHISRTEGRLLHVMLEVFVRSAWSSDDTALTCVTKLFSVLNFVRPLYDIISYQLKQFIIMDIISDKGLFSPKRGSSWHPWLREMKWIRTLCLQHNTSDTWFIEKSYNMVSYFYMAPKTTKSGSSTDICGCHFQVQLSRGTWLQTRCLPFSAGYPSRL